MSALWYVFFLVLLYIKYKQLDFLIFILVKTKDNQ